VKKKFAGSSSQKKYLVQLLCCGILSKRQSFCVTLKKSIASMWSSQNLSIFIFLFFPLVHFTHKINSRMLSLSNLWEYLYFFYFPTFCVQDTQRIEMDDDITACDRGFMRLFLRKNILTQKYKI
jgi:hypothetical protein